MILEVVNAIYHDVTHFARNGQLNLHWLGFLLNRTITRIASQKRLREDESSVIVECWTSAGTFFLFIAFFLICLFLFFVFFVSLNAISSKMLVKRFKFPQKI